MDTIDHLEPLLKQPHRILGLDAYGVMYNGRHLFNTIIPLIEFCKKQHIPVYMMTNNATQSPQDISVKMQALGVKISPEYIISSGCGCFELPNIKQKIEDKNVFVYGYPQSEWYATHSGGILTDNPNHADIIIMAASLGSNNHTTYHKVFNALKNNPNIHVICINPDHYIAYNNAYMPVMGFYAHQMEYQLGRPFEWIGKPFSPFSKIVSTILKQHGHNPQQLLFCDDNPWNVQQVVKDLTCQGCIITKTGMFPRYKNNFFKAHPCPQNIVFQAQCSL
jgi:4-nitrophenyl phosphatase